ncbi:hypothetical protein DTO166G4_7779 [Paecilomyces variotii]|nr:hypothetical protein DTO166G4_7779 [Paecilomyces variotii]KAJ9228729.1 hypothetical protein DTO166G5_8358 [Paecilomyces variotii]
MTVETNVQTEDPSRDQVARHSIADGSTTPVPSSTAGTAQDDSDSEDFKLSRRAIMIFFTLSVLTLMAALDGTSISVALPIIAERLHGTAIEAFWAGTSFLLCSTVFQPSFASFSNIFGRKPLILTSILFFFVGAVIAGVAKNFVYMLVGRSLQGVGGGGIIALSEIIVTDIVPLRLRGNYFGILSAMWSIGSVTGPILGGGFSENVTWRWIFYINFPFIGIGVVLVLLFLKLNFVPSSLAEKLRRVDYTGTVLFIGSTASFLIPLSWGGVMYDWDSWRTLVPLIIGAVGLIAFAAYEYYVASDPIIPPTIFQNRTAVVSFVGAVLQGLVLWCALYYMPLYYEAVKEYSPIRHDHRYSHNLERPIRWAIWLGWAIATLGMGILCIVDVNTSIPGWIFLNLVPGLGLGILFPSIGFAVQASATPKNLSIAVAMFSFFRAFGQAIGVAIGGVVFQNRMHDNLLGYPALAPFADAYSKDAAGLVQVIKNMPDGPNKSDLKQAYTDSLRIVWAVSCAICGVAGLFSLLTQKYDLNRALETSQGLRAEKSTGGSEEEGNDEVKI